MKKIHYFLGLAMSLVMAASISSCEDVPAPYQLFLEDTGTAATGTTGTRQDPYIISDAIKAQASGKSGNVWVKGYIVGFIPSGGESTTISNTVFGVTTEEQKSNSNIVIAASADEQVTTNCMAIQLPAGAVRNGLNIQDNPTMLGDTVLLYGSLEKYCGAAGLKSVTYAEARGQKFGIDPDTSIVCTHITIKEFLEKKDPQTPYEITGVASNLNATYASFDLTEDGAKIYIYRMNDKNGNKADLTALGIAEGDTVTVTGAYLAYTDKNGNVKDEINPATFVSVKKGKLPDHYDHISIGEFLEKKDASTAYELTGVVKNIVNTTYGNFDLVEGTDTIYIYGLLDASGAAQKFTSLGIADGDTLTLTGTYKDYNGKAEIANARYVSHVKGEGGGGDVPPVGESITLDFSTNTWGLPESSANISATQTFTNGEYSITLTASEGFKYCYNSGYMMLGKEGATLTFQGFDFAVARIEITGRSGASGAVKQNIYVGETAVSTQTLGAQVTNTYEIAADYQAAGNQYTLKVESAHNTQITKIVIYKAVADKE